MCHQDFPVQVEFAVQLQADIVGIVTEIAGRGNRSAIGAPPDYRHEGAGEAAAALPEQGEANGAGAGAPERAHAECQSPQGADRQDKGVVGDGPGFVERNSDRDMPVKRRVIAQYPPHGAHGCQRQAEVVAHAAGMHFTVGELGALDDRATAEEHAELRCGLPRELHSQQRPLRHTARGGAVALAPAAESFRGFPQGAPHADIAGIHIGRATR